MANRILPADGVSVDWSGSRPPNHPWFKNYTYGDRRRWEPVFGCRLAAMKWNIPGVYAIYQYDQDVHNLELVYIGHASCIRSRLTTHARRFRIDWCKAVGMVDRRRRAALERRLLFRLRPRLNRQLPSSRYGGHCVPRF
jgi:hypothetical protein